MEWTEGYPCTLLKLPESDYNLTELVGGVKKDFFGSCLKSGLNGCSAKSDHREDFFRVDDNRGRF